MCVSQSSSIIIITMKSCIVGIVFIVAVLHHSVASYSDEENIKVNDDFNRQADYKKRQHGPPVREGHFSENDGLNELPAEKYDPDFRNLQRPFRMAKLNLVWTKAQQVSYVVRILMEQWEHVFHANNSNHLTIRC